MRLSALNYKYLDIKELSQKKYKSNIKSKLFLKILLLIIALIIIGLMIWLIYGKVDVIIKANGIIQNKENISYIYNIKGGYLDYIIPQKRQKVNKGELLFSLSNNEMLKRKRYLEKKLKLIDLKINDLKKIRSFIRKENMEISLKTQLFQDELTAIKGKIKNYNYNIKIKRDKYKKLKKLVDLSITENELINEKKQIENLKYKLKEYKQNKLIELEKRISSLEDEITSKKIELDNVKIDISKYKIHAPIGGKLEYLNKYNIGDYIAGGVKIMKIIPPSRNKFIVDLIIKNKDILKIKKGDKVVYKIASFPYKEHGTACGKILKINSDTTKIDDNNYIYKAEASINNFLEKGNNKRFVRYKNGMLADASIVVRERKIIYYILEKLDFLNTGVF